MNEHCKKYKNNTKEKTNMQINAVHIFQELGSEGGRKKKCKHNEKLKALTILTGRNFDVKKKKKDIDDGEAQLG